MKQNDMTKQQKKAKVEQKVEQFVQAVKEINTSDTDPQGSYTGRPENAKERPVQDADDL